jgi:3',5'-cyclic AMP phosphodiesterase CpdA
MSVMRSSIPALGLVVAAGCLEYSPHAIVLDGSERDLHGKALARLAATPAPEAIRFAVVGDTQIAFDEAEEAVAHLNERDDLSFVVQVGDFTHFGLLGEFRRMNEIFARLRVPYFVVIGIHEHLGNGEDIYGRMFGPTHLAFTYGRTRFVLFDSNSREFGFDGSIPDLAWLAARLAPDGAHERAVLLSHCPPGTGDFDPKLVAGYDALLRDHPSVLSFHGHEHAYRFEERVGTPLYVADGVDHRSYLVATLHPTGGVAVERVWF